MTKTARKIQLRKNILIFYLYRIFSSLCFVAPIFVLQIAHPIGFSDIKRKKLNCYQQAIKNKNKRKPSLLRLNIPALPAHTPVFMFRKEVSLSALRAGFILRFSTIIELPSALSILLGCFCRRFCRLFFCHSCSLTFSFQAQLLQRLSFSLVSS